MAHSITLQWWALEVAFGHVDHGHWSFLDRKTGRVISIREEIPEDLERLRQITAAGNQYVPLEPVCSRDQYAWMSQFIPSVADRALRQRLNAAIAGPSAFRAFKDVLQQYPEERLRWFSYRKECLREHIERWFKERRIPLTIELPEAPAAADLRERCHRLLDRLPRMELPNTVGFLLHLSTRPALAALVDRGAG